MEWQYRNFICSRIKSSSKKTLSSVLRFKASQQGNPSSEAATVRNYILNKFKFG